MHFRISEPFSDSLAKLTGDEQKAANTTAFDLQLNRLANYPRGKHAFGGCLQPHCRSA